MKVFAEIETKVKIPVATVCYLMSCAFQGMGYWGDIKEFHKEEGHDKGALMDLIPHGLAWITVKPHDSKETHKVDKEACLKGLKLLSEDAHHFNNVISENYDAETGDVFMQYVCFGKVIYG